MTSDNNPIWHPLQQGVVPTYRPEVISASGVEIKTKDGKTFIDLISSWWTCVHGHSHPAIVAAMKNQLDHFSHVIFTDFTHDPAAQLARKLTELLPGDLSRVFFSDNGSTSVEVALKMALHYWMNKGEKKRKKLVAFEGAYHGETVGAMSVGDDMPFLAPYKAMTFSVDRLPFPHTWMNDEKVEEKEAAALLAAKKYLDQHHNDLAAVIVEPLLQGAGGMRLCRPQFLKAFVKLFQDANVLVIFDEVATGFGRLGKLFALEIADVTPDFICLSKGLTAGFLPMGLTVVTEKIYQSFVSDDFKNIFPHTHAFMGNALACAAAIASLDVFAKDNVIAKIKLIEDRYKNFLNELKRYPKIHRPRYMGSVMAFELGDEQGNYHAKAGKDMKTFFWEKGLFIRPLGNTFYLMPPYVITDHHLNMVFDAIHNMIGQ